MAPRLVLSEVNTGRVGAALARRLADLPHAFAWQLSSESRKNRAGLAAYQDLHKGRRCIILANGPSLAHADLEPLKDEITFGMNRIYLNFGKMGFESTYFLCINELVLEQFGSEIAALSMPKFLNWNRRSLFQGLNPSPHYLRFRLGLRDDFQTDASRALSSGGTVTYAALQLAFFMGFRQVILVGLDHRFASRGTPNQMETRDFSADKDHFRPDYFPPGARWQLPDLRRSELAYAQARRAYEADGRQILDATLDGACTAFEKANYKELFF